MSGHLCNLAWIFSLATAPIVGVSSGALARAAKLWQYNCWKMQLGVCYLGSGCRVENKHTRWVEVTGVSLMDSRRILFPLGQEFGGCSEEMASRMMKYMHLAADQKISLSPKTQPYIPASPGGWNKNKLLCRVVHEYYSRVLSKQFPHWQCDYSNSALTANLQKNPSNVRKVSLV